MSWLATSLLALVMTIVPTIISSTFTLGMSDVANDVTKNQLIPGWGFYSSIVNRPDFSARLTGFVATILLFIALAILVAVVKFVKCHMVKNSRTIAVILELTILYYSVNTIIFMFTSDNYNSLFGIEHGFGFYFVAVVLSILLLIINVGVWGYFWSDEE